jgi:hypothetical protein
LTHPQPPPAISTPTFGALLRRLRGPASRGQVCRAVAGFGLALDRSTLLKYEAGRVNAPDPAILWALGRIYQLPNLDDLLRVLVVDRTGQGDAQALADQVQPIYQLQPAEILDALTLAEQVVARLRAIVAALPPDQHHVVRRRA